MKTVRTTFTAMGVLFLVIAIVLLGVSGWLWQGNQRLMDEGISAEGVFLSVGKSNTRIGYEAEGQEWVLKSNVYSSSMRVGDSVTVWYMPDDPGSARMTTWVTWGGPIIGGSIFGVVGLVFFLVGILETIKRRSLMIGGTRITAQITDVAQNQMVKINREHPYVIRAKCVHPYTGQEMTVKSGMILKDPRPMLAGKTEVDVLVDPMKEKRYYMLVEEIG